MTRSITTREAEYTDRDRAVLFEAWQRDNERRDPNGIKLSDATDPAQQYDWKVGLPTMNFAQAALNKAMTAYKKAWPDADTTALIWEIERD